MFKSLAIIIFLAYVTMKTKVFISSTFSDLEKYRTHIWEFFKSVDLKITGMENFGSNKRRAIETCLKEVEDCDIYVGIIGYRYGSIDEDSLKSFTQLEYEEAKRLNKEILIYLMHERALTFPVFVDTGESADRLKKFKETLLSEHTVSHFKESEELTLKIYNDVKKLIPKSKLKLVRQRSLKAKVTWFYVGSERWIAFIGYLNGKPYEIFTGFADEEMFPIPQDIETGRIIREIKKEELVYSFQFIDKYGYENVLGGLMHKFNRQVQKYSDIINTLLQEDTDSSLVNDVVDKMEIFEFTNSSDWKKGVKVALNKK